MRKRETVAMRMHVEGRQWAYKVSTLEHRVMVRRKYRVLREQYGYGPVSAKHSTASFARMLAFVDAKVI